MDSLKKVCKGCKEEFDATLYNFYSAPTCQLGLTPRCKPCHRKFISKNKVDRKDGRLTVIDYKILVKLSSGETIMHSISTVHTKLGFVIITDLESKEEFIYPSQNVLFVKKQPI